MKPLMSSILMVALMTVSCAAGSPDQMPIRLPVQLPEQLAVESRAQPFAGLIVMQCGIAIGVIVTLENGGYEAVSFSLPVAEVLSTKILYDRVPAERRRTLNLPPPYGCGLL